jgi:hypothetical protein
VGQWLTTPEVLAVENTNKELTLWGVFVPNDGASSILMVNGRLMAKAHTELFQQAVNYLFLENPAWLGGSAGLMRVTSPPFLMLVDQGPPDRIRFGAARRRGANAEGPFCAGISSAALSRRLAAAVII